MKKYEEKKFTIGTLTGLSERQIAEHLKLYAGYVKHVNLIAENVEELSSNSEKNAYLISELRRRFAFEFDGMRMHEFYFESFEEGKREHESGSTLGAAIAEQFGSFDNWLTQFKTVALSRGIGWTVLSRDPRSGSLINHYAGDHELGHLAGLDIIIALDMWEHAYMIDYTPGEKKQYVEAFLSNLNWRVPEGRFNRET
ncbi:MAG: superoxide dismutase, Fe-Mn family [Parcubacteria group bacterium Gr01-1014_48]|nr:MAG: superoxide dismutase, Fe-Mn family [Parcubacteria group bacterium Greene0416_14]TSC72524.1 MAG: superoxide dismutase, Fe-Mn family [Parcubacteria group bacterium Gr01-1014_48]TSD00873.1 MAG: superoxide dismutase, Fe-Mn family [Parcubacteria group bacterium Greene1014_15]TSD07955.1 MAG: superoxide dismutase, Fe-Mn family [Parcubacteria group bacterium Greene0714_4]